MKTPSARHGFVATVFAWAVVVGLTACDGAWPAIDDAGDGQHSVVAGTDPIALRLAESADKAATALQDLARVETTRRPPAPEPATVPGPSELHSPITIDWVGGAEPLVRNIAARLKYDVVVTGTVPPVPVVVQIHQRNREAVEALRNIGDQATQYIDLVVDPQNRKIEIRYLRPEATQS